MLDIAKQVAWWQESAKDALGAARDLLEKGRRRYALFFAHLALEKALKACVCRRSQKTPPRTHNLLQLAGLAQLALSPEQREELGLMNMFCLEGRYPEPGATEPTADVASRHLRLAEELVQWLLQRS